MASYLSRTKGIHMSESISKGTFDHLVDLAALELETEEADYLLAEMNKQIKSIHELEQIPIDEKTPPARHGVPFPAAICPPLREDEVGIYPNADDLLKQAPSVEERYILVPDIPHTELE
jgi:aspartyl-tRNA(Asn)/glutamyl-tRNA(Gln) amidotransferase subunit C